MSWNIKTPGDFINGPLTVAGNTTITGDLTVDTSTLKVDSTNDRVGIGTTTPAYKLEVVAPAGDNIVSLFRSGDATAANNAGGGFRSISSATAASRVAQIWLDADGADLSGGDYFFIQKNGNSGTVEFNQFSNAAMTFLTNGTERARFNNTGAFVLAGGTTTANGIGVAFPTTQSASSDANTLDDYEEGTFTPVVQGSTDLGVGVYSIQTGRYTKIGRLVTVEIYIIWTTHTGTGNLRIGGLPFNVANSPYSAVTIGLISDVSLSASNMAVAFNEINQNFINIYQIPVGGGAYSFVPMDVSGTMILSSTYTV
jgi:hypothetical protein